ncbi:hypothetical protein SUGI_0227970 [Cryptomeria japonica]|nr:hypothetical protein SUGI_0227970 [Cryptomeria japonica]
MTDTSYTNGSANYHRKKKLGRNMNFLFRMLWPATGRGIDEQLCSPSINKAQGFKEPKGFEMELSKLEHDSHKEIAHYALAQIQTRVVSFDEQVLTRTCCFSRAITKLLYTIMVPSLASLQAFNKSLGDNKRTLVHLLPHSSQETTTIPFCFQWPPFQVISKRSHLHIMYLANQAIVGFSFVNKIFHHEMEVAYSHPEATMEDMHNQIFYSHRVSRRSCSPCFQSSTTTLLANY